MPSTGICVKLNLTMDLGPLWILQGDDDPAKELEYRNTYYPGLTDEEYYKKKIESALYDLTRNVWKQFTEIERMHFSGIKIELAEFYEEGKGKRPLQLGPIDEAAANY